MKLKYCVVSLPYVLLQPNLLCGVKPGHYIAIVPP